MDETIALYQPSQPRFNMYSHGKITFYLLKKINKNYF